MFLTNWVAKKDNFGGLANLNEIANGNVRLYGLTFTRDGLKTYITTDIVKEYDGSKIKTLSGDTYVLGIKDYMYTRYVHAGHMGIITLKDWEIICDKIIGKTEFEEVLSGTIVSQNIDKNICILQDGKKIFVDWTSCKNREALYTERFEWLTFCDEECMPKIFN